MTVKEFTNLANGIGCFLIIATLALMLAAAIFAVLYKVIQWGLS